MAIPKTVALKIERAIEHVECLHAMHEAFFKTHPYAIKRIVSNTTSDKSTSTHLLVWERYEDPPVKMALLIGDAVHNLRSALDHLAFELSRYGAEKSRQVITPLQERAIQFPIASSQAQFSRIIGRGNLLHVESGALKYIEERQPFNKMPQFPDRDFLSIISSLDNFDKHRTINVALAVPSISRDNWPSELVGSPLRTSPTVTKHERGGEVGYFTVPSSLTEDQLSLSFGYGLLIQGIRVQSHPIPDLLSRYIASTVDFTIRPIADQFLP